VQTSGQFRDIAECRIHLLDRAVQLANEAPADPEFANYVREGTASAERALREKGMSPLEARNFASARVFGGVGGSYGTGIMGLVESGDQWEDESQIAEQYLQNMGAIYTRDHWGHYAPGLLEASLQNTDTVVQPRSSNVWGPLSLDHVYEFTGGINAAVRHVTGEDPSAYFNDLRNQHNARVQGAEEAIAVEARSTVLNPRYIEGLQEGDASSAEVFAETFRNTYGWNVMKPDAIQESMWEDYYDVYIEDALDLNMQEYFEDSNPYALQEMSAVMLETIRKEYWDADDATIENLSSLHASLVEDHGAGCSGFVCDNAQLREFIAEHVDMPETAEAYMASIESVRTGEAAEAVEGMRLEPEKQTMEVMRELVSENMAMMIVVLVLVAAFSGAVYYGAMRRTA
ncbi:MAG: cobaltochelatase subunit CobN, partial [Candidatus Hydrogenedentota bacterium]